MLSVQYVCNSTEAENNPVFLETTMPSRNEVHHNFLKIIQIQIEGQTDMVFFGASKPRRKDIQASGFGTIMGYDTM